MKNIHLSYKIAGTFVLIVLLLLTGRIKDVQADEISPLSPQIVEQSSTEDAVITEDDLPGFHKANKNEIVGHLALAKRITLGIIDSPIEIRNISYFRSDNLFQSEYVINFLVYPISATEKSKFDLFAGNPQNVLEALSAIVQSSGVDEEPHLLPELGDIGEKSVGFTMLLGQEPVGSYIDFLWVRRENCIQNTWVFYPYGLEPSIDLHQLGSLVDQRVKERFIGTSFRSSGLLVPEITTHIPTPLDISTSPSVISTNLLLAALMMLPFTAAAEVFTRLFSENAEMKLEKYRLTRWLISFQRRSASFLDARLKHRTRTVNVLRLGVILIFYGLVFSLLERTWNPFSVTGLVLFLSMTVAYGLVGLVDDIVQWRFLQKWGNPAQLALRPTNLIIAGVSTITSRLFRLVPGLMFGTPEVLSFDESQLDSNKRNSLFKISALTLTILGLSLWALTIITTLLQKGNTANSFQNIVGGLEGFFLLVFAVTLENTFIRMLGMPGSFGEALRKRNRWLWLLGLVFITFTFYHTLINPRGELAEALQNANVRIFLIASGSFVVFTFSLWIYIRIKTRKPVVNHRPTNKIFAFMLTLVLLMIGGSIVGFFLFIQQKQLPMAKDEIPTQSESKTQLTITQMPVTDNTDEITMDFIIPATVGKLCFLPNVNVSEDLFDAILWRSVQFVAVQYGAQAEYIVPETTDETGYTKAINQLVQENCDLIIGQWVFQDQVFRTAAKNNPDQSFLLDSPYESELPNLWVVKNSPYDVSYLAGYAAAAVSKSGKVGTYTGFPNIVVNSTMNCFAQGVRDYNEAHQTDVTVLGWNIDTHQGMFATDYNSPNEGILYSDYLISQGADIIIPVAALAPGWTGYGAGLTAQQKEGVLVIGWDFDWAWATPEFADVILTSIEKRFDRDIAIAVDALANGKFLGGEHLGTLRSSEIQFSPLRNFSSLLSPDVLNELSILAYSSSASLCQPLQLDESDMVQAMITLMPENTPTAVPSPTLNPRPTATPDMRTYNPENGHWYLVTREMSWFTAIDYCSSLGGHLLIIDDASEDLFVFNLNPDALLGASDKDNEGNWVWGATGESLSYTNWDNGEPNNCSPSGNSCIPEHYLAFWDSTRPYWNDISDSRGPYICEWEQ